MHHEGHQGARRRVNSEDQGFKVISHCFLPAAFLCALCVKAFAVVFPGTLLHLLVSSHHSGASTTVAPVVLRGESPT